MTWVWLEAAVPLGIIGGVLCIMGNSQYYIHKACHGGLFSPLLSLPLVPLGRSTLDTKVIDKATSPSS